MLFIAVVADASGLADKENRGERRGLEGLVQGLFAV